jgi:predicted RNA-binding Zn-ribbon protein involved in translation (DUF1610 family)
MCEIDNDGEECTIWRNEFRRSRRARKCQSCSTPIAPGERYLNHFNVYDGSSHTESLCASCGEAAEEFRVAHGAMPTTPMWIEDVLDDCADNDGGQKWRDMAKAIRDRRAKARSSEIQHQPL